MDFEKAKYEVLQSEFHKKFRVLRAMIIRGKKMWRMQPAETRHFRAVVNQGGAGCCDPITLIKKHASLVRMTATGTKRMKLLNSAKALCIDHSPQTASPQTAHTMGINECDSNKRGRGGEDCSGIDKSYQELVAKDFFHELIKDSCMRLKYEKDNEMQDEPETDKDSEMRTSNSAIQSCTDHSVQMAYTMVVNACDSHKGGRVEDCSRINTSCQEMVAKDFFHEVIKDSCIRVEDAEGSEMQEEPVMDKEDESLADKRMALSNTSIQSCTDQRTQLAYTMAINEQNSDKGGRVGDCSGINISCREVVANEISQQEIQESWFTVENEDSEMKDESETDKEDESVAEIWKEMSFALESFKESPENLVSDEPESRDDDDCHHSFILKDDIGSVCRVCGLIEKGMEDIFEFYYPKRRQARSYRSEPRNIEDSKPDETLPDWSKLLTMDLAVTEVSANEKHMQQMKPHQREGFNFLVRNLVSEDPHGCILAHAPGSGKTFMIICFMQSFLAKYPCARPLVVLPKGIVGTWKKEFQRWQMDEVPLYDFYSVKAVNRSQQLGILFLGYKQFTSIVTGYGTSKDMVAGQEILIKAPTVLILDEGHTPRNDGTDTLNALIRVQTRRKVVLSGTLYQNHVKEVFNILNLVQPRFLKLDANRTIVRRILSKVEIPGIRKQLKGGRDAAFYDLLENTLLNDENYQRKVGVIKYLREMTRHVLHYYKGDSFDELPGLIDFTVLLSLSPKQRIEVEKLKKTKERKFRSSSIGSAIYIHPQLKQFSGSSDESKHATGFVTDEKLDQIIEEMNLKDGVKAKFFLNLLRLCEIAQEKLLVFSHYLLPLRFLERLAIQHKGWTQTKEIFMITGESTTESREWSMEQFNNSTDARVLFGSVKACGEGISLVGASRILILDVHPNPSVSWQAVCRAFRPGHKKKVYTYRLVAADSPEEEDHLTCFRKELVAKMWFEWNEFSGKKCFDCQAVDLEECGDTFLQSPLLANDVKALYKRFVTFS